MKNPDHFCAGVLQSLISIPMGGWLMYSDLPGWNYSRYEAILEFYYILS